jgi:WD40 repeat protein
MRRSICIRMTVAFASLALIHAASRPADAGLVGNDDKSGMLYNVNIATGAASDPRSTGISDLVGIAYSPGGMLYGLTAFLGGPTPNALYRINPTTGASSLVGATGLKGVFEGDLGFDPTTGVLYGVQNVTTGGESLFTINTSTGVATTVGNVEKDGDLSALAFDKNGNLFILDDDNETLLEVNKSNGSIIHSVSLSLDLGPVGGMAFNPSSGQLYVVDGSDGAYAGTNSLYTLNTTTGALTLIGNTDLPAGLAGLTFTAASVPEPSGWSLLGMGSLASLLGLHRARRECPTPRP